MERPYKHWTAEAISREISRLETQLDRMALACGDDDRAYEILQELHTEVDLRKCGPGNDICAPNMHGRVIQCQKHYDMDLLD